MGVEELQLAGGVRMHARRAAGAGADQVRDRAQYEERKGPRLRSARRCAPSRRRGNRITRGPFTSFAASAHSSSCWPKGDTAWQFTVRIYGTSDVPWSHSGLMPANFTTFLHFSISSATSLAKSAGEPGSGVPPRSASRALNLGSARAALISLLSLSTISAGVFLGAPIPCQALAS